MTSKQVLLTFTVLVAAALMLAASGCATYKPIASPYHKRRVLAVVPLRNESGTLRVDAAGLADKLARTLEHVEGVDVLPVNRVLAAMRSLKMRQVADQTQALKLVRALDADALVVGTVTAYDPYDPPKLGLAVEMYVDPRVRHRQAIDTRALSEASTQQMARPNRPKGRPRGQPVSTVSAVYDAANPRTRRALEKYAANHGQDENQSLNQRLYRISMDLYSDFVSHQVCARLMQAEAARLTPPTPDDKHPPDHAHRPTPKPSPTP